jgi:hypothetical protein
MLLVSGENGDSTEGVLEMGGWIWSGAVDASPITNQ